MLRFRALRHATDYKVPIKSRLGTQTVKLSDINCGGAKLTSNVNLTPGDRVSLSALNNKIEAVVLWVNNHDAGITFRPQISQTLVDKISHCGSARANHQARFDSSTLQEMR